LAPAIQMADGYPMEAQTANSIERDKAHIKEWKYSRALFLTHAGQAREAPEAGEIFVQKDLAVTLRKLVAAEREALKQGKTRKQAIYAAYDRFYKGDITIYQAMSLAFADRDFYYGDPYFPPEEPTRGLLSKDYAKHRYAQIDWTKNDPNIKPGDPFAYQGETNPFADLLSKWTVIPAPDDKPKSGQQDKPVGDTSSAPLSPIASAFTSRQDKDAEFRDSFYKGTTSIEAADAEGWVVSVTPSGGWVPAVIAGHTGVGLSQRAQAFVTDQRDGPFNVIEPGKRPRVTLTPTLALKDGLPYLAFAVQGGDSQDQNLLQFFLNVVEFGMTVQQATEAANINSYQMRSSFGAHESRPGRMLVASSTPDSVRAELQRMGYTLEFEERTSGPINAILFDRKHGTFWGGSSNHGEDYGIAW
ncbi:MAG TPA: gamma-glutamyltransferase, partial [Gemmatimonadaceae bacterium]|nr:gamma-glutamyltransferase [Gemmatimonadaceae bacterium]